MNSTQFFCFRISVVAPRTWKISSHWEQWITKHFFQERRFQPLFKLAHKNLCLHAVFAVFADFLLTFTHHCALWKIVKQFEKMLCSVLSNLLVPDRCDRGFGKRDGRSTGSVCDAGNAPYCTWELHYRLFLIMGATSVFKWSFFLIEKFQQDLFYSVFTPN